MWKSKVVFRDSGLRRAERVPRQCRPPPCSLDNSGKAQANEHAIASSRRSTTSWCRTTRPAAEGRTLTSTAPRPCIGPLPRGDASTPTGWLQGQCPHHFLETRAPWLSYLNCPLGTSPTCDSLILTIFAILESRASEGNSFLCGEAMPVFIFRALVV